MWRKIMTKPMDNKSQEMKNFIEKVFPGTQEEIAENRCPVCKKPIGFFSDVLSLNEYYISGMCQECQDSVFGK